MMFFNNLEFMEIPLDVLAKDFRNTNVSRRYQTVVECSQAFLQYLQDCHVIPTETSERHIARILLGEFEKIDARIDIKVREYFSQRPKTGPDLHAIFIETVREKIVELEGLPPAECFDGKDPLDIVSEHADAFRMAYRLGFPTYPLDKEYILLLRLLAALILHRDFFSGSMTGLVFAGFGSEELFPTLIAMDCDGIIAGRLKIKKTNYIDIDRRGSAKGNTSWKAVDIIPFAQTDMAERFLVGIDSDFEAKIVDTIEEMHEKVASTLAGVLQPRSKARRGKLETTIHSILKTTFSHFKTDSLQAIKSAKRQQIEDMALFMPKQELAFLAEAMINLTSIKRRVSAEEETVAGPIDVAVISRNEGLVWVKRKHYFDPALNPRYFHRLAKRAGATSGGNDDAAKIDSTPAS